MADQEVLGVFSHSPLEAVKDASVKAIGTTELAIAWQRAYEVRTRELSDETRQAASAFIANVLNAIPQDQLFAEQQRDLREFTADLIN